MRMASTKVAPSKSALETRCVRANKLTTRQYHVREVMHVKVCQALQIQVEELWWQIQCDRLAQVSHAVFVPVHLGAQQAVTQTAPVHEATLASIISRVEPVVQTMCKVPFTLHHVPSCLVHILLFSFYFGIPIVS